MVTFGGAYAVLTYVAQRAVEHYGWLSAADMVRGLALAETTPGPLIMVAQFVAFLGAYTHPGALPPRVAAALSGITAAVVGVIAHLGLCFALHTLFAITRTSTTGPLHLQLPDLGTLRPVALAIAVVAAVVIFCFKWTVLRILGLSAVLGLVAGLIGLPGV